jgi:diguanylate cyclase (GGDEF)-like protein
MLVIINYYLSKTVAINAIQSMQNYEKKVESLFTAMETEIDSQKLTQKEMEVISIRDELTGLYNRHGFMPLAEQYLKTLSRDNSIVYILYMDIDRMKHINASYGHQEGDSVIKKFADILQEIYRESDLVARIGDDEFAVIPVGLTEPGIELINSRLQEKLDEVNSAAGKEYTISISYGLVKYNHEAPCSVKELLARSEKLMYKQKKEK